MITSPGTRPPRLRARVAALLALALGLAVVGLAVGPAAGPARADQIARPVGSAVGTTSDDGATVVSETWLDERTLDLRVTTPSVPGTAWPVRLLLPEGWQYTATRTWPLMMLLHGGEDDYTSWARETDVEQLSSSWNTIVAMPDAGYGATYTNYFNQGRFGPPAWETFHTQELLQLLERGYHAGTERAVAGLSGGGYGAMIYAAHHPGLFRYAASYSGSVGLRMPLVRTFRFLAAGDKDPSARFGVPFVNEANWKYQDPIYQAEKLRGTAIYLSSGLTGIPSSDDTVGWTPIQFVEAFSGSVNQEFSKKLDSLGIPHTTHFYPTGEHAWVSWQKELHTSWPLMMAAIGADRT